MASVKLYAANALSKAGVTVKNGSGGGAPLVDQNSDWPMSLVLCPDRESYYRTSAAPPDPLLLDLDLGSAKAIVAAGILRARLGAPTCVLFYNSGSSYNPASGWVAAGPFASGGFVLNNNLEDVASIVARFWRFEFDGAQVFSCKPWLMEGADTIDLGHDWHVGTTESLQRLQEQVVSPSGQPFVYEPAEERGSFARSGTYLLVNESQTARDALRDKLGSLDTRFLLRLGSGALIETTFPDGDLAWSREWNQPESFGFGIPLVECP